MTDDIFARNPAFSPALLDDSFALGLYRLARYRIRTGGLPAQGSRDEQGFLVGQWLYRLQANPHVLSEVQRAYLLAVPGLRLSPEPLINAPRTLTVQTEDQRRLWDRISTWACPDGKDKIGVA